MSFRRWWGSPERTGSPIAIVLDHMEEVTGDQSRAGGSEFVMRVPAGWQVALAAREHCRSRPLGYVPKRDILELGPAELASDRHGGGGPPRRRRDPRG